MGESDTPSDGAAGNRAVAGWMIGSDGKDGRGEAGEDKVGKSLFSDGLAGRGNAGEEVASSANSSAPVTAGIGKGAATIPAIGQASKWDTGRG